ncbi:phosphatase PAP2 family protein [Geodermatophilus sp. URMC 61]|uniref:phosphatase PAP2 family protein n=1 Tax=Geodermatophilus sp. URMC 61 TaxID=3423411 RepID=UPI00406CC985
MTSGAVRRRPGASPPDVADVRVGRPPRWLLGAALVVTVVVTVDLLSRGVLERMDLRVSEVVSGWDLQGSAAYWPVWAVTQLGGRGFILIVLAGLVGYLAWRFRTVVPLLRVLLALGLLTVVVYSFKFGTGRTAPAYPGSFFHRDGASYPSGHVANAVLMWGVARWQVVQYRLAGWVQQTARVLSVVGPVATGVAMVSLDFHWVTDAVVGAAVGILLLGVVHLLDTVLVSRWVSARAGRSSA